VDGLLRRHIEDEWEAERGKLAAARPRPTDTGAEEQRGDNLPSRCHSLPYPTNESLESQGARVLV